MTLLSEDEEEEGKSKVEKKQGLLHKHRTTSGGK
jgi:hypothetical protein